MSNRRAEPRRRYLIVGSLLGGLTFALVIAAAALMGRLPVPDASALWALAGISATVGALLLGLYWTHPHTSEWRDELLQRLDELLQRMDLGFTTIYTRIRQAENDSRQQVSELRDALFLRMDLASTTIYTRIRQAEEDTRQRLIEMEGHLNR